MFTSLRRRYGGLGTFFTLFTTQSLSALGSAMTNFALVVWSYQQWGSALATGLLSVCSYTPYVVLSIFAGALSDRWDKRRTMLWCDSAAALCTLLTFALLATGHLQRWHLYLLGGVSGLMNAFQQPAAEVAVTLLVPREQYHQVSGVRAFGNSLVTVLAPVLASAVLAFGGMGAVILVDLSNFAAAALTLAAAVRLPATALEQGPRESVWRVARAGLAFLARHRGVLQLILFLAAINFTASIYNAALPALLLPRAGGGQLALGLVNTAAGLANLAGSAAVSLAPPPKRRVRVVLGAVLISMGTENLLLALGRGLPVWCLGAVLGWFCIPAMNANLDVLLRQHIPVEMQGRVFAVRNALQFFTIPCGYLAGGALVDGVCEPLLAAQPPDSLLVALFGSGRGSGAALLFFFLAVAGVATCLLFARCRAIWTLEETPPPRR